MTSRLTAALPDGSRSRIAWVLWMIVGLLVARLIAAAVIFLEAGAELIGFSTPTGIAAVMLTTAQTLLPAAVLAVAIAFAETRLLMPREVWLSIAVGPLFMWLQTAQNAVNGEPPLMVWLAIPVTLSVFIAWLVVRHWRSRRSVEG